MRLPLLTLLAAILLFPGHAAEPSGSTEIPLFDSVMTVLSGNDLSFDEKYQLVNLQFDRVTIDYRIELMKKLVQLAKREGKDMQAMTLYSNILLFYANMDDFEKGQLYLDSALYYTPVADDLSLAKLHYAASHLYVRQGDLTQTHEHLYQSLSYFEKVGGYDKMISSILVNIGLGYVNKQDSMNVRLVTEELAPVVEKLNDPVAFIEYYILQQHYYSILYNANKDDFRYRDSTIMYNRKIIDTYHSLTDPPDYQGQTVSIYFIFLASDLMDTSHPNLEEVKSLLEEGKQIAMPGDFEFFSQYHLTYAKYYLQRKEYASAVSEAEKALELIRDAGDDEYAEFYANAYEILADIHEAKGEYPPALTYRKLQMKHQEKVFNEQQHASIYNIRTQYEVEKKEQHIRQLTELNEYQQKIRYLYLGIIILVVFLLFFAVIWFRNKRKADAVQLGMVKLKQEEAELKSALETAKLEEKNKEYQILLGETQQRQMKSYLEGLEAERTRLARDLHDVVSNEFVAVNMKMEKDGFDKDSFRETLHSLHNKVRNISHALMPPVFKYAAFCDILEDYVSRQKEYFTGNIELNIRQQEIWDSLPAAVTLDIYRIVQEGLSNAVKHACAGDISLQFDSNGDTFRFSIEDDGEGFDTTATTRGIGLRTMRERVENLPGEMTLTSETGKGTKMSVIFHLADLPHP